MDSEGDGGLTKGAREKPEGAWFPEPEGIWRGPTAIARAGGVQNHYRQMEDKAKRPSEAAYLCRVK